MAELIDENAVRRFNDQLAQAFPDLGTIVIVTTATGECQFESNLNTTTAIELLEKAAKELRRRRGH